MPRTLILGYRSGVPLPQFQMAPILRFAGVQNEGTKYACLSEAKASHSHSMWSEVCSSVPQLKFATSSGSKKGTQICK